MDWRQFKGKEAGQHKYFPENTKSISIAFAPLFKYLLSLPVSIQISLHHKIFLDPQFPETALEDLSSVLPNLSFPYILKVSSFFLAILIFLASHSLPTLYSKKAEMFAFIPCCIPST